MRAVNVVAEGALVYAAAACVAGCQTKSAAAQGFVSAAPAEFAIHAVERIADQQAGTIPDQLVIVSATFENTQGVPEIVAPNKFVLTDQATNATYYGLSGGNVNAPVMSSASVEPGKSIEIAVGFRVPITLAAARLTYHP